MFFLSHLVYQNDLHVRLRPIQKYHPAATFILIIDEVKCWGKNRNIHQWHPVISCDKNQQIKRLRSGDQSRLWTVEWWEPRFTAKFAVCAALTEMTSETVRVTCRVMCG